MGCFSLGFVEQLCVWIICVIALISILKDCPALARQYAARPGCSDYPDHIVGNHRHHRGLFHLRPVRLLAGWPWAVPAPLLMKRQPIFIGEKVGRAIGIALVVLLLATILALGSSWLGPS
jgi:hypothetical protein